MRIAVVYHRDERGNSYGMYISEMLSEYASWLGYKIDTYHDYNEKNKHKIPENIVISIPVNLNSSSGLWWMYNVKLPSVLNTINANILICLNGICSKIIKQPQLLLLPDITYLKYKKAAIYPWQKYSQKNFRRSINKAAAIITYSNFAIEEILKINTEAKSVQLTPFSASLQYHPLEWPERVLAKSQFTGNKEYFVCIMDGYSENEYIPVLKAFSKFKKWQQSSMQMLFITENNFMAEALEEKIATYKYREDVQLLDELTPKQIAELMASAYALIHIAGTDSNLLPLIQGMQSAVPVLTNKANSVYEYCKDAVLYFDEKDFDSLGAQMIEVYKDENKRTTLTGFAKEQSQLFVQEKISEALWKIVEASAADSSK